MTISAFSDELTQVRTKKKEFLSQIERIVPWGEWLAMIQGAGIGVAVANALPEVKAAADYVTERDSDHDAAAEIIERFIL